jgi:hypothetical protein
LTHGDLLGNCNAKVDGDDVAAQSLLVLASPVPTRDVIAFTLMAQASGMASVEIFDLLGTRLLRLPAVSLQADEQVVVNQDLSAFASGVNFLRVALATEICRPSSS